MGLDGPPEPVGELGLQVHPDWQPDAPQPPPARTPGNVREWGFEIVLDVIQQWLREGHVVRQRVPYTLKVRETGHWLVGALALQLAAAVEQGGRDWCRGCGEPLDNVRWNRRYCDRCRTKDISNKLWYERHGEEQRAKARERYDKTKRTGEGRTAAGVRRRTVPPGRAGTRPVTKKPRRVRR
jgi:hypothetical protein